MIDFAAKVDQLKSRIARKKRNHESCAADEVELRKCVLKQLRRENRQDRKRRVA